MSSAFQAVGFGPRWPWSQVVSWGRVGPALRPILTFSLLRMKAVAELLEAIWAFSLPL